MGDDYKADVRTWFTIAAMEMKGALDAPAKRRGLEWVTVVAGPASFDFWVLRWKARGIRVTLVDGCEVLETRLFSAGPLLAFRVRCWQRRVLRRQLTLKAVALDVAGPVVVKRGQL